jgi:hypothetical protein
VTRPGCLSGRGQGWQRSDCRQSRVRAAMADVCTSLMAERRSFDQCERGCQEDPRAALAQQLFLGERGSALLALHQLSSGAVTACFPLDQLCWGLFLAVT